MRAQAKKGLLFYQIFEIHTSFFYLFWTKGDQNGVEGAVSENLAISLKIIMFENAIKVKFLKFLGLSEFRGSKFLLTP